MCQSSEEQLSLELGYEYDVCFEYLVVRFHQWFDELWRHQTYDKVVKTYFPCFEISLTFCLKSRG